MLFPASSQKQFVKIEEISPLLPLEAISETEWFALKLPFETDKTGKAFYTSTGIMGYIYQYAKKQ